MSFENTVGKGEIAHTVFLPFFLRTFRDFSATKELSSANTVNLGESKIVVWKRVKGQTVAKNTWHVLTRIPGILMATFSLRLSRMFLVKVLKKQLNTVKRDFY